jgi:hypothetical protein
MVGTLERRHVIRLLASAQLVLCLSGMAGAKVCNIKGVTDANPDYSDNAVVAGQGPPCVFLVAAI